MTALLTHHLAVALARLRKTPLTSAANVTALALGLACFMAAWGVAAWWRSSDSHHPNADRLVAIGQRVTLAGQGRDADLLPFSSATVARYLREDFPEIAHVVRARAVPGVPISTGGGKDLFDAVYVEPAFTTVFALEFVEGDAQSALTAPQGVVLTEDAARRLFGGAPALGRDVRIDGAREGVVTGVIAPVRQPSFMGAGPDAALRFDMLLAWASHSAAGADTEAQWFVPIVHTFVALPEGLTLEAFDRRLAQFAADRIPSDDSGFSATLHAFPVRTLATFALDRLLGGQGGRARTLSALIGLGVLTLAVACVNYANLATAQAAGNAQEVGLRKTLGAGRAHVMTQAWLEALVATLAAAVLALAALALAGPAIRVATGVDMLHFLRSALGPAVLVGLVVAVTLLAGLYPALVLSGVRPADAFRAGRGRAGPRSTARLLVGVQFASASLLLILVIVTQLQRAHIFEAVLGPRQDPILILADASRHGIDYDTLAERLRGVPGVESVSVADKLPLGAAGFNVVQLTRSPEAGAAAPAGYFRAVGLDYFDAFSLPVLAGRVFDPARNDTPLDMSALEQSQTPPMVIDRTYARRLGFAAPEEAVGQIVYLPASMTADGSAAQPTRIIGVTESEPAPLHSGSAEGTAYFYAPRVVFGGQRPIVRIEPADIAATVEAVTTVWDALAPDIPVDIQFFDALFEESFRAYARVSQIFMLLASSAFGIATIGLLGMAVHVTSRRRREIGVRKTLGSTTLGIVRLLLIDFSRPVLVGNLLAWPLGYAAAEVYLRGFAERAPLTPAPFALSMAITLAIAWAAVIGEVLKAASVRPADVLRHA